ncbi:MAG TPA: alpha/beta hydrolase-fold protein [Abditibacteriaceae bacterium]
MSHFAAMLKFFAVFIALFLTHTGIAQTSAQRLTPEVAATRVAELETRVKNGAAPVHADNAALWRFKIEQARLMADSLAGYSAMPWQDAARLQSTLDAIAAVEKAPTGVMLQPLAATWERAYFAADGSPQPYWIYLPPNYSPQKKWPLVVLLHGYNPQITKADPWLPGADAMSVATERGFIVAIPYGRRNTDFLGVGEDDTLAVRAEMLRRFRIDEDRVFLLGPSMGGYGVWAVGLKHPHLWAGLSAMAARSDTWNWLRLQADDVAPWKKQLYLADDPRFLARNARNLPVFFQHGSDDHLVPVEHSRLIADDWKKLGYPARYREIPGGDHYIYWLAGSYEAAFDWMKNLRRETAPRRVTYSTASLWNHRAHWVSVEAFDDYSKPAHIDAEVIKQEIRVTTENVGRFVFALPAALARGEMKLVVNGAQTEVDGRKPIEWNSAEYNKIAASPNLKSPTRTGTIRDAYRGPLLLVYGDTSDRKAATRFVEQWQVYADGTLPLKSARDVSLNDRKNFNLVLFGTRESNPLLAEISDSLPIEKTADGYRIGTEKKTVANVGVIFCYPSPFDARREIVVHSGIPWGTTLPENHPFDLQPDYLVFTPEIDAQDKTNVTLEAGFFDGAWQLKK